MYDDEILLKSAICINGHIQTTILEEDESYIKKFCSQCGSKIIDTCPSCNAFIIGGIGYLEPIYHPHTYMEIDMKIGDKVPSKESIPYYCHNCGKPYPWTVKFLNDYQNLLNLYSEEINIDLNKKIYDATENFLKNKFSTTSFSAIILKKYFSKLPDITKQIFINVISNFAGETLKNYFFD